MKKKKKQEKIEEMNKTDLRRGILRKFSIPQLCVCVSNTGFMRHSHRQLVEFLGALSPACALSRAFSHGRSCRWFVEQKLQPEYRCYEMPCGFYRLDPFGASCLCAAPFWGTHSLELEQLVSPKGLRISSLPQKGKLSWVPIQPTVDYDMILMMIKVHCNTWQCIKIHGNTW